MAQADPKEPKFQKWLRSIEPRQELVMRFALRTHFPTMRADQENTARIDALRAELKLDEDSLAMVLADARKVAADIEAVIDVQPVSNRVDRMRGKRG